MSIITVCYNSEETIEQTIKSVLGQSYDNIEYIIVDGLSTDGTKEIIKRYRQSIDKFISEPDDGIYDAMNKGIRMASGDIVGIINSDDWYEKDTVYHAVKTFEEHPDGEVAHGRQYDIVNDRVVEEKIIKNIISSEFLITICHPTFFVKRSVYERYGVFDCRYKTVGDGDFVFRLYLAGVKFYYNNDIIAYFRWGGASSKAEALFDNEMMYSAYFRNLPLDKQDVAYKALYKYVYSAHLFRCIRYLDSRIKWNKPSLHKDKKFAIFCYGWTGQLLCDWIIDNGRKNDIVFFIDNDVRKDGLMYKGIPVKCYKNVVENLNDLIVVIASFKYFNEISMQLRDIGMVANETYFDYCEFKKFLSGTDLKEVTWYRQAPRHSYNKRRYKYKNLK